MSGHKLKHKFKNYKYYTNHLLSSQWDGMKLDIKNGKQECSQIC